MYVTDKLILPSGWNRSGWQRWHPAPRLYCPVIPEVSDLQRSGSWFSQGGIPCRGQLRRGWAPHRPGAGPGQVSQAWKYTFIMPTYTLCREYVVSQSVLELEPTTPHWGWRWTRGAWGGQLKSVWKLCMHTWGQMQQSATARWNWRSSAGIQSTRRLHQEPELSVLVISLTSNVLFLTKPGTRQCKQLVERLWETSRTSGSRPSPTFELNTQYYVPYVSVWVLPQLMPRTQQKPRAQ